MIVEGVVSNILRHWDFLLEENFAMIEFLGIQGLDGDTSEGVVVEESTLDWGGASVPREKGGMDV
jgi:hypothetical protein